MDLNIQFWKEQCESAFSGNTRSNDFILFFEGCKTLSENGLDYTWNTDNFDTEFQQLMQQDSSKGTWQLPVSEYTTLANLKNDMRTQWHSQRQQQLRQHLKQLLNQIQPLLDLSPEQRLSQLRSFLTDYATDLGAIPFIRGLVGFFRYQLQHPSSLVDWQMSEYVLSQNNEEAMTSYVHLLGGVLGLQLVYQDNEENTLVIPMEPSQDDVYYTWRMNPDFDNAFIEQALSSFTKQQRQEATNTSNYRMTDIPRKAQEHQSLFQWLYHLVCQCLSFFHIQ